MVRHSDTHASRVWCCFRLEPRGGCALGQRPRASPVWIPSVAVPEPESRGVGLIREVLANSIGVVQYKCPRARQADDQGEYNQDSGKFPAIVTIESLSHPWVIRMVTTVRRSRVSASDVALCRLLCDQVCSLYLDKNDLNTVY